MAITSSAPSATTSAAGPLVDELDPVVLGRRLRHLRKEAGLTLDQAAEAVGATGSHLSLIENGKREPRLSLLSRLAALHGSSVEDLLATEAPSRRAATRASDRATSTTSSIGTDSRGACASRTSPGP